MTLPATRLLFESRSWSVLGVTLPGATGSLNVTVTGVFTATPVETPSGVTVTTVGGVVSGGGAATVVNDEKMFVAQRIAGQIRDAAGPADDSQHVRHRVSERTSRRESGGVTQRVVSHGAGDQVIVRMRNWIVLVETLDVAKASLNVTVTGVVTATPVEAPAGVTATTVGGVVSANGFASVVNDEKIFVASALPARSVTPPDPPTTVNMYVVEYASAPVGVKVAVSLSALYVTVPATRLLLASRS